MHTVLSQYSTTATLTLSYNLGAVAGTAYGLQVLSGLLMATVYVASETYAFHVLDRVPVAYALLSLLAYVATA